MYNPDFTHYLNALKHKKPDIVPLSEFWVDASHVERVTGQRSDYRDKSNEGIERRIKTQIKFALMMGYDFIFVPIDIEIGRPPKVSSKNRYIEYEHDGVLATRKKFEEFIWAKSGEVDVRSVEIANRLVPEGMKIIINHPGIVQDIMTLMGMEDCFIALYDDRQLVEEIIDRFTQIVETGLEVVKDYENIAVICSGGDMAYTEDLLFPPDILRTMFFHHYRRVISRAHNMEKKVLFHTDGRLFKVLDDFIDMSLDGLHPIEPKAMDILEVRKRVGDKLCLIGNVDLDWPLTRGTAKDVRRSTFELLEKMAVFGSFCLGSSSSITGAVPFENYLAMVNAVHEFNGRKLVEL